MSSIPAQEPAPKNIPNEVSSEPPKEPQKKLTREVLLFRPPLRRLVAKL